MCCLLLQEGVTKIDSAVLGKVPLSYFLGTLGMPGMTVSAATTNLADFGMAGRSRPSHCC